MTAYERHRGTERQALELLPWYVNGTLADEERELVRRELLNSLTCRMEFERLRRLQQAMQREDGEAAATERAFEQLLARIEGSAISRPVRRVSLRQLAAWPGFAQAALLLVFVPVFAWWWFPETPTAPKSYETLSTPQPAETGVTRLRVVLAPGLSEAALGELIVEHRLTIIDGPTREGLYTFETAAGADLPSIVAALKADPRVRFTSTPAAAEVR